MPLGNASGRYYSDKNGHIYPIRNGLMERVWKLIIKVNGFERYMYIRGTEQEMRGYADSEISDDFSYHAIPKEDEKLIKQLREKIYIAPQINSGDNY